MVLTLGNSEVASPVVVWLIWICNLQPGRQMHIGAMVKTLYKGII